MGCACGESVGVLGSLSFLHPRSRYSVTDLLNHPFFKVLDYKIGLLPPDDVSDTMGRLRIELQQQIPDKETAAAIVLERDFDPDNDDPMDVAKEMVNTHLPFEEFSEVAREIEKLVTVQKADATTEIGSFGEEATKDDKEASSSSVSSSPQHISRPESGVETHVDSPDIKPDNVTVEDQVPNSPKPEDSVEVAGLVQSKPPPPPSVAPSVEPPVTDPPPSLPHTSSYTDVTAVDPPSIGPAGEESVEGTTKYVKLSTSEEVPLSSATGGGDKPRKSRQKPKPAKEGKRPMKLLLTDVKGDDIAECQFTNSGQQISFTFSLQADTTEVLTDNMVGLVNV